MPEKTDQEQEVGYGKRLRWAKNIVRKWQAEQRVENHKWDWKPAWGPGTQLQAAVANEVAQERYERACALILADKLRNS